MYRTFSYLAKYSNPQQSDEPEVLSYQKVVEAHFLQTLGIDLYMRTEFDSILHYTYPVKV